MKKSVFSIVFVFVSMASAYADTRTAEDVIASIDSSGWAVDPTDFGMTAMEFQRKEADHDFHGHVVSGRIERVRAL